MSTKFTREYRKKIKAKKDNEFWDKLIETEKDKLLHFIIAYNQKNIVLVKSGEKDAKKNLLGIIFQIEEEAKECIQFKVEKL